MAVYIHIRIDNAGQLHQSVDFSTFQSAAAGAMNAENGVTYFPEMVVPGLLSEPDKQQHGRWGVSVAYSKLVADDLSQV